MAGKKGGKPRKTKLSKDVSSKSEANDLVVIPVVSKVDSLASPKIDKPKENKNDTQIDIAEFEAVKKMLDGISGTFSNDIRELCSPLLNHNSAHNVIFSEYFDKTQLLFSNNVNNLALVLESIQNKYLNLVKEIKQLKQQVLAVKSTVTNSEFTQTEVQFSTTSVATSTDPPKQNDFEMAQFIDKAINTESATFLTSNKDVNIISKSNVSNTYHNLDFSKIIMQEIPETLDINKIVLNLQNKYKAPNSSIKIIKSWKARNSDNFNYVFMLPSNIAKSLLKDKSFAFDANNFTIKSFIDIIRCFQCQKLNSHLAKNCTNPIVCANCSKQHNIKRCTKTPSCANCSKSNETFGTNFKTNHPAYSSKCEFLRTLIKNERLNSNF